jgi:hypothetical protein
MRFGLPWGVFKKYGSAKVGHVFTVATHDHVVAAEGFASMAFGGFGDELVAG